MAGKCRYGDPPGVALRTALRYLGASTDTDFQD